MTRLSPALSTPTENIASKGPNNELGLAVNIVQQLLFRKLPNFPTKGCNMSWHLPLYKIIPMSGEHKREVAANVQPLSSVDLPFV